MGRNADTVRKGIELFNKGNIPELLQLYDDKASVEFNGSILGGAYRGKTALIQFFQKVGEAYPTGVQLSVKNVMESGDMVVVEWTATGKLANGKEVEDRAAHVFELSGGKVVHHRGYPNTEEIARAAGEL